MLSGIFAMWFDHYMMWFCLYVFRYQALVSRLLAITNWLNQFLDGSQFLLFPSVKDNKMGGTSNNILSTILDKMHLGHLIDNFQCEKVTVNQIHKLSSEEMEL